MTNDEIKSKVEEYMKKKYKMEIVEEDDGFAITYPDLSGCISIGDTVEEVLKNGDDARREWFYAMIESGESIPEPSEEYSGHFRLRVPKSLHKELAERSKQEGISMNQYCIYLLSKTY